jgi:hypothetical protein
VVVADPDVESVEALPVSTLVAPRRNEYNGFYPIKKPFIIVRLWRNLRYRFASTDRDRTRLIAEYRSILMPDVKGDFDKKFKLSIWTPPNPNHTHGDSAGRRTAARESIFRAIRAIGKEPFVISPAASFDGDGIRYFFAERDLHSPMKEDKPSRHSVIVMIDVDYYIDDIATYLTWGLPIAIYTFAPRSCSGLSEDAEYFVDHDHIVYNVTGGATYRHKLWHYEGDFLSVVDRAKALHTFAVSRKTVPDVPDRSIIFLAPTAVVPYPFWCHIPTTLLKRRDLTATALRSRRSDGEQWVSLNICSKTKIDLPEGVYESVRARYAPVIAAGKTVSAASIVALLASLKVEKPALIGPLLLDVLSRPLTVEKLSPTVDVKQKTNIFAPYDMTAFKVPDGNFEEDNMTQKFSMNPVVSEPALTFPRTREMELLSVQKRITDHVNTVEPPPKYSRYASLFLKRIVPDAVLSPLPFQDVVDRLNTLVKKKKAEVISDWLVYGWYETFKVFLKADAADTPNAARVITNPNYHHNLVGSQYGLVIVEHLKKFNWYTSGLSPIEVCERMREFCVLRERFTLSDVSHADASHSIWIDDNVTTPFMNMSFNYDTELDQILKAEQVTSGITRSGVKIPKGSHNKSGSWFTSGRNSVVVAFIIFCAHMDAGLTADEAFEHIGLVYSDDAVTSYCPGLPQTAKNLGFTFKVETSDTRVKFLSRIWPNPRVSLSSYCDVERALRKIHLTVDGSPEALANKAAGYTVTDSSTPIVGLLCETILRLLKTDDVKSTREDKWKQAHPWPQDDVLLLKEDFQTYTQLDDIEVKAFNIALRRAKFQVDLCRLPVLTLARPPAKITYDDMQGVIVKHSNESPEKTLPTTSNPSTQGKPVASTSGSSVVADKAAKQVNNKNPTKNSKNVKQSTVIHKPESSDPVRSGRSGRPSSTSRSRSWPGSFRKNSELRESSQASEATTSNVNSVSSGVPNRRGARGKKKQKGKAQASSSTTDPSVARV